MASSMRTSKHDSVLAGIDHMIQIKFTADRKIARKSNIQLLRILQKKSWYFNVSCTMFQDQR